MRTGHLKPGFGLRGFRAAARALGAAAVLLASVPAAAGASVPDPCEVYGPDRARVGNTTWVEVACPDPDGTYSLVTDARGVTVGAISEWREHGYLLAFVQFTPDPDRVGGSVSLAVQVETPEGVRSDAFPGRHWTQVVTTGANSAPECEWEDEMGNEGFTPDVAPGSPRSFAVWCVDPEWDEIARLDMDVPPTTGTVLHGPWDLDGPFAFRSFTYTPSGAAAGSTQVAGLIAADRPPSPATQGTTRLWVHMPVAQSLGRIPSPPPPSRGGYQPQPPPEWERPSPPRTSNRLPNGAARVHNTLRDVTVDGSGRALIELVCVSRRSTSCNVRLSARTTRAIRVGKKRRRVSIGPHKATAPHMGVRTVRIRLPAAVRRELRRTGRLGIVLNGSDGADRWTTRVVLRAVPSTLRADRRRRVTVPISVPTVARPETVEVSLHRGSRAISTFRPGRAVPGRVVNARFELPRNARRPFGGRVLVEFEDMMGDRRRLTLPVRVAPRR